MILRDSAVAPLVLQMLVLGGQVAAFEDIAGFKPKLLVLAKYDVCAVLAMIECMQLEGATSSRLRPGLNLHLVVSSPFVVSL